MIKKLTLRLDEHLIEKAKIYSARKGKSLSALVADFFSLLEEDIEPFPLKLPPKVASLKGILKDKKVNEDDYRKYLEKKFL